MPSFSSLDWMVLAGYFAIIATTGWLFSRREVAGAREYFLAGRQMPMWAVAISVLATATSAATFIGAPQEAYQGNLTYASTNIGMFIAVAVVALFFIPAFYAANVTTVYDLLAVRLGPGARSAASWAFLAGRVFASGARLFMAGIPLSMILFGDTTSPHMILAIVVLSVVAVLYTLVGGIRSIIWTDVIQTVVFVGAAAAALGFLWSLIPAPAGEVFSALRAEQVAGASKLTLFDLSFDLASPYSLPAVLIGFSLLGIASYGTDHDLAQRMLTCKSAVKGSQSVIVAILINLPVLAVFMSIGLLLHVLYQRPDLMLDRTPRVTPDSSDKAFLTFILNEMPPGMRGLMMAGLFAAGLGSCLSAINAMSAAFVNDIYKRLRPGLSDRDYLVVGRWAVAGWGAILGAFACACVFWYDPEEQTLINFALGVMSFAYAGLLGVFFTALFTRRGNSSSAVAAIVVGALAVLACRADVWRAVAAWSDLQPRFVLGGQWPLVVATLAATAVCCSGSRRSPGAIVP